MLKTIEVNENDQMFLSPSNLYFEIHSFCGGCEYGNFFLEDSDYERYNHKSGYHETTHYYKLCCNHMPVCLAHHERRENDV